MLTGPIIIPTILMIAALCVLIGHEDEKQRKNHP